MRTRLWIPVLVAGLSWMTPSRSDVCYAESGLAVPDGIWYGPVRSVDLKAGTADAFLFATNSHGQVTIDGTDFADNAELLGTLAGAGGGLLEGGWELCAVVVGGHIVEAGPVWKPGLKRIGYLPLDDR